MAKNFCSNCGLQLTGNENFCAACGQQVSTPAQSPTTPTHHQPAPHHPHKNHGPSQGHNAHARDLVQRFDYPANERHSEIITMDDENGEPVVKFRNLHPNATWLFFFQYLGRTAILPILFILAAFIEPLVAVIAMVAYLLAVAVVAKLTYLHYEFEVSTVAFRKVHGIFHKHTINIAFDQIQNINKRRSIVDQILGLAHIEIETAGTGGTVKRTVGGLLTVSEGYIPGITPQEAEDVLRLMLARSQKQ